MVASGGELDDHQTLTQYGRLREGVAEFRDRPRSGYEDEVSLLEGRWSVADATRIVRRVAVTSADAVRYTNAGRLRGAGFEPRRNPTRRNPSHIAVKYGGVWDDEAGNKFDDCF